MLSYSCFHQMLLGGIMETDLDFSVRSCERGEQEVTYQSTGTQMSFQMRVKIARDCSNESQPLLL